MKYYLNDNKLSNVLHYEIYNGITFYFIYFLTIVKLAQTIFIDTWRSSMLMVRIIAADYINHTAYVALDLSLLSFFSFSICFVTIL